MSNIILFLMIYSLFMCSHEKGNQKNNHVGMLIL